MALSTSKTDNSAKKVKAKIRLNILKEIESPKVVEFFCGSGESYRSAWCNACEYLGVDKKSFFDERKTIVSDAISSINKIDLHDYNIFDLDAYGSPYDLLFSLVEKISFHFEKIAFVITDGTQLDLKMGNVCKGLRKITGIKKRKLQGAHLIHDFFIDSAIKFVEKKLDCKKIFFQIAKSKKGSAMRYYSFIVEKNKSA